MAHERLFPVPDPTSGVHDKVNALYVTQIRLDARTEQIMVTLFSGAASVVVNFTTEVEAQAFVNLWTARVEDAR